MPLPLPNKTLHIAKLLAPSVQKSAKARKAALAWRWIRRLGSTGGAGAGATLGVSIYNQHFFIFVGHLRSAVCCCCSLWQRELDV